MASKLRTNIEQQIKEIHTQAVIKHKQDKSHEALYLYLQAIELDQNQPEWIYGNAIMLCGQIGKLKIGVEIKKKAEKLYPASDEIYRSVSILFHNSNKIEEAIECYLKAIDLNHEQPEWLYIKLIALLIRENYFKQAKEIAHKAIKRFPDSIILKNYFELVDSQNTNSLRKNVSYSDTDKATVLSISRTRQTPSSLEHCVDLNIDTLRRELMDSAIIDKYQILLTQLLCNVGEGVKTMDVDALVHCLAEIKTDIHYLKTKLLNPPVETVDPQTARNANIEKIISLTKPIPIKCDLKERIVGSGWHAAEEHGRWTGPGILSSIVLPYPAKNQYRFEMIVLSEARSGLLNTLKININDESLSDFKIKKSNRSDFPVIIQGNFIASAESVPSFLAIDLIIDETIQLQEADDRFIGLLIEKISLIPIM